MKNSKSTQRKSARRKARSAPPSGSATLRLKGEGIVIEVRSQDGAQCIRYGPSMTDVSWLCGIDRVSGLKVGDTGKLYYKSEPGRGRDVFMPNVSDQQPRNRDVNKPKP